MGALHATEPRLREVVRELCGVAARPGMSLDEDLVHAGPCVSRCAEDRRALRALDVDLHDEACFAMTHRDLGEHIREGGDVDRLEAILRDACGAPQDGRSPRD